MQGAQPTPNPDAKPRVTVVGVPLDENSSFLRGPASAPARIREVLHAGSMNWCIERGLDLAEGVGVLWQDIGDLDLGETRGAEAIALVEQAITDLLAQDTGVLTVGGDHSITYSIISAHARKYPDLTIIHFDAHPDLYDDYEGNPFSHASPFARIMERGLVKRLIQVGIRTMNPHQRQQAERFGVQVHEMRDFTTAHALSLNATGPIYLSLDLDVLDPAFAPGVSHHEPGGLTSRDLLTILSLLPDSVIGGDIVEFNPARDPAGITAMVGAKMYKEFIGKMLQSRL